MTTETLDKLYLEWSQFTRARTAREIEMLKALKAVEEWWLSEGKDHFQGAPYAMFATRAAVANAASPMTSTLETKP